MIIKGGCRSNGAYFAKHLLNAVENRSIKLVEVRSLAARNIGNAFYEMKAVASGTRCKNFFYHASINPLAHESLTPEQWERAVDVLEKRLGLEGQPRFVVEHDKKGRVHRHVVWSRVDVDRMVAIPNNRDFEKHQAVTRQLEKEFGLEQGKSVLGPEAEKGKRPARRPKSWEVMRGQKSGIDVKQVEEEVTALWKEADSPETFRAKLEGMGYVLARGDRRTYCIVDRAGDVHSLARRVKGVKASEIMDRLSPEIALKTLPNVRDAAAYQRERIVEGMNPVTQEEARREGAVREEEDRRQQVVAENEVWRQAGLEAEQQRQAIFKEQSERQVEQTREMQAQAERLEAYKADMARRAEQAGRETEQRERERREGRYQEGNIRNAHTRYGEALGQHYNMRDPYESLARSAMAEYGAFLRDRENLDRQIAKATDPVEREKLQIRKEIEAAEYMAITSERIAGQSEIIVGKMNSPEAIKERARARAFTEEAQKLRSAYVELARGRMEGQGRSDNGAGSQNKSEELRKESPRTAEPPGNAEPAIMVEARTPGKPPGPEQTLGDYVRTLPEKEPFRTFSVDEISSDPAAKKAYYAQLADEKNREVALRNLSRDMKAGQKLNSNDIRLLNREELEGIRRNGDKHLKTIVQQHEKERARERGRER